MNSPDILNSLPRLRDADILLRELTPAELGTIRPWLRESQREILAHSAFEQPAFTLADIAAHIVVHSLPPWGIVRTADQHIIGVCAYTEWRLDHSRGRIAFAIEPGLDAGRHLAQALLLVIEYGFTAMNLRRVETFCPTDDSTAAEAVSAAGMNHECTFREYFRENDRPFDVAVYGALRPG